MNCPNFSGSFTMCVAFYPAFAMAAFVISTVYSMSLSLVIRFTSFRREA